MKKITFADNHQQSHWGGWNQLHIEINFNSYLLTLKVSFFDKTFSNDCVTNIVTTKWARYSINTIAESSSGAVFSSKLWIDLDHTLIFVHRWIIQQSFFNLKQHATKLGYNSKRLAGINKSLSLVNISQMLNLTKFNVMVQWRNHDSNQKECSW